MKWLRRKDTQPSNPSLEQQRAEKLAELGELLGNSRKAHGLTLEEAVMMTRVPRRLLQAIETGNLQELPEPIYTQGLIRQYADALGYNGAEFASKFPIGSQRISMKPIWANTPLSELRPVHLYLLYVVVIFCSVNGLSQLLAVGGIQVNKRQQESQSENLIQVINNSQKPQLQNASNTLDTDNGSQLEIGVTIKEKSWIRVVVDGRTQYEGELPQGTHRIWQAHEQLTVKARDAGSVLVSVNKEQAKQMGEPGTAKEVTIAASRS
ncbi:helix-turn-helix domain-containing protein [Calothrix sp. 336/3]|uniref:helix-turn-helix domain-containing protein n=1 Tax=Calothrix sp. 336/3 TaxID=1337936 RepID=UPI0004E2C78A|nr:RodZ domain-containing protein [Calothrix sp. 336/3]AKG21909.1 DNA-binding protein [Calothrix sp. 336/3]